MTREFTKEEVMELVKVARVYAPGLTNERFRALVESEAEVADDLFFEASWALARLAREHGVSPIQAIDRYQEIMRELRDAESAVSQQRQLLAALEGNVYTVRRELADTLGKQKEVQKAGAQEEAELAAFRKAAEKEKQAISVHLARARERAQVTEQEIVAAGELKADLSRRGLRLGLVLDLSHEIPDDEEAKGRLAAAIERHGSLVADTAHMEVRLEETTAALAGADKAYKERRKALDDLRADEAQQAELWRFHKRFSKLEPLMDCSVTWEEIGLRRCISCGSRFWAEVKPPRGIFYIQRDYFVCPRCGSLHESFDEAAHRAAGLDLNPKARLKFIKEG